MPEDLAANQDQDERAPDSGHAASAADAVRARLAARQDEAADAYTAITAADAALRPLAQRRVAAEQLLRHAAARHHAASRAAAAHARARPGPLAQLRSRLRARSAWRARDAGLQAALTQTQPPLAEARQALSLARDAFAAQVRERAEAVTALRRLTAECAAAREELLAGRKQAAPSGETGPGGPGEAGDAGARRADAGCDNGSRA
jgi:hypothetical protein